MNTRQAMAMGYATGAYPLTEIGRFFGKHYSTVTALLTKGQIVDTRPESL